MARFSEAKLICGISHGKNDLTLTHPFSLLHFHLEWRDESRDIDVVADKILLFFGVTYI